MGDKDETNQTPQAKQPKTPEAILAQIEAEGKEARMKELKQTLSKMVKERDEAARTVRLKEVEIKDTISKHIAGVL